MDQQTKNTRNQSKKRDIELIEPVYKQPSCGVIGWSQGFLTLASFWSCFFYLHPYTATSSSIPRLIVHCSGPVFESLLVRHSSKWKFQAFSVLVFSDMNPYPWQIHIYIYVFIYIFQLACLSFPSVYPSLPMVLGSSRVQRWLRKQSLSCSATIHVGFQIGASRRCLVSAKWHHLPKNHLQR